MDRLFVFGAGVRAHVAVDLIEWQLSDRYRIEGYYDDGKPAGSTGPGGFPILGKIPEGLERVAPGRDAVFLALGTYASARSCEILLRLREKGVALGRLVSPRAHIAASARIADNALIMPGVFVGADARLGDLVTAHGGVVVEHHCTVGHNVLLGPGVTLSGFVGIASHAFLGVGSTVMPERRVGAGAVIGAGAVVVRDVDPSTVAFGNPARKHRDTRTGDEVPDRETIERLRTLGIE